MPSPSPVLLFGRGINALQILLLLTWTAVSQRKKCDSDGNDDVYPTQTHTQATGMFEGSYEMKQEILQYLIYTCVAGKTPPRRCLKIANKV